MPQVSVGDGGRGVRQTARPRGNPPRGLNMGVSSKGHQATAGFRRRRQTNPSNPTAPTPARARVEGSGAGFSVDIASKSSKYVSPPAPGTNVYVKFWNKVCCPPANVKTGAGRQGKGVGPRALLDGPPGPAAGVLLLAGRRGSIGCSGGSARRALASLHSPGPPVLPTGRKAPRMRGKGIGVKTPRVRCKRGRS
jgi:hypothetical protein